MFQSMVEGRPVPRSLLTQDVPSDRHNDLDFLADLIDLPANLDPEFKKHHYLEPIPASGSLEEGIHRSMGRVRKDRRRNKKFSAKELTVMPGARCTIYDPGASGVIVTQGQGTIGKLEVDCPSIIRFGQMTQDEVFISHEAALAGVTYVNQSQTDPLVTLRYFGPDAHRDMPNVGDHKH